MPPVEGRATPGVFLTVMEAPLTETSVLVASVSVITAISPEASTLKSIPLDKIT